MLVVPERQLPHHHHRYELDYLQEEEESRQGITQPCTFRESASFSYFGLSLRVAVARVAWPVWLRIFVKVYLFVGGVVFTVSPSRMKKVRMNIPLTCSSQ